MNNPLKYLGYSVVFQEVPDEVSLAINISGCPHRCEGCHSQYLWEYKGEYLLDDIKKLLSLYEGMITCVCFMGGDQNPHDLINCFKRVKDKGLKICLYSGAEDLETLINKNIAQHCDYVKTGRYNHSLGGLDNPNTNQRFYQRKDGYFEDITKKFYKKHGDSIQLCQNI